MKTIILLGLIVGSLYSKTVNIDYIVTYKAYICKSTYINKFMIVKTAPKKVDYLVDLETKNSYKLNGCKGVTKREYLRTTPMKYKK